MKELAKKIFFPFVYIGLLAILFVIDFYAVKLITDLRQGEIINIMMQIESAFWIMKFYIVILLVSTIVLLYLYGKFPFYRISIIVSLILTFCLIYFFVAMAFFQTD